MRMTSAARERRLFLVRALAAGLFCGAAPAVRGQLLGRIPAELPPGTSFYDIHGEVSVNGAPATLRSGITANDTVSTGRNSQAIFVVGKDAFLLREGSAFSMSGGGALVEGMRLATGAVLSVFGKSRHQLVTPAATIGIRGTGIYVESRPDESYVCTCYGTTEIVASGTAERETIESRHHDFPRYVLRSGSGRIRPAGFINHTDEELTLIEALVGRTPPFALFDSSYGGARRY